MRVRRPVWSPTGPARRAGSGARRPAVHSERTNRTRNGHMVQTDRTPGCAPLKRRRHSPARSTCAAAPSLRSSPLGADMVGKSRNMSADMLFMPGLLALMPPTICCVRSQSVRDLVTEISAVPRRHRCGVAQSSSSELATQARPSQPHSRLKMPVHVGSRLASSGSPTHPSPWADFRPYPVCDLR